MKKTFMERYNDAQDKEQLRKESFRYFNDKYFKEPFTNYWIIEQTERFKARKLKFFMPGRIYTYQYMPHGADVLDFYDKRPMVYIIGEFISPSSGMHIVQGVNLNFLPEKAKAQFIDTAYRIFGDAYKIADEMSDDDRLASMKVINKLVTNWFFMANNFDKNSKIGLAFAVRNYDITQIKNPVLIEVEDFEMVPYFVPRELAGKAVAFVYQLYAKSRMEILNRSALNNKDSTKVLTAQKKYKTPGG